MIKSVQSKAQKRISLVVHHLGSGRFEALSSIAESVLERRVSKTLTSSVLLQSSGFKKSRIARAPQLSDLERKLRDLQEIVEALAVRSVAHDQEARVADIVDFEGVTLLDANTAYQLLDNPGEPNEALSAILALR
ncbi:MAG: hypothetical protein ACI9UK_000682 [Candidatus Krumholzibacteriia bacterium]|jgi:hypothetical protein